MSRYIDADLFKAELNMGHCTGDITGANDVEKLLDLQPTANVRNIAMGHKVVAMRKHIASDWRCSECGALIFDDDVYCSICGAVMEDAEETEEVLWKSSFEDISERYVELRKYNIDLQAENAALKARLDKAVELPLNIGDLVYRKGRFGDTIIEAAIYMITKSKFGFTFKAERSENTYFSFDSEDIGKTAFLTKAEAQAKLEELKGGAK